MNMLTLNGKLMSADREIAKIEKGDLIPTEKELMPLYLQRTMNLEGWLKQRSIDQHRTNSRILKRILRLSPTDDISAVMYNHASSITDNFWIKKEDEKYLNYKNAKCSSDLLADVALRGNFNYLNINEDIRTPELTNVGSFEKCWKYENNSWYMYKYGTEKEVFSELFIAELGKALKLDMAEYAYSNGYIKTKDFTENGKYNFEPASAIVGEEQDYNYNVEKLSSIDENLAKEYLKLIWLDTIVINVDRHTENYGFLRNPETGQIIKMAPNYDNNVALVSRAMDFEFKYDNSALLRFFEEMLNESDVAVKLCSNIEFPILTPEILYKIADKVSNQINIDDRYVDFSRKTIMAGYNKLTALINEKTKEKLTEKENICYKDDKDQR